MVKSPSYEKLRRQRLLAGAKLLNAQTKFEKERTSGQVKIISAETKFEKQQLKSDKFKQGLKEKKAKQFQQIIKKLSKPITSKKIFKQSKKMELHIKNKEVESIWDDPNRFFKGEIEEAKRTMFFS